MHCINDCSSPIQDGAQITLLAKPALPPSQSAIRPESVQNFPLPIQDGAQIALLAKPALPPSQSAIRPESVRNFPSPIQGGAQITLPAKPALPPSQSVIRPESVRNFPSPIQGGAQIAFASGRGSQRNGATSFCARSHSSQREGHACTGNPRGSMPKPCPPC